MAYKFKVGDKASYRGRVGVVETVRKGTQQPYKVRWENKSYNWFTGKQLDRGVDAPSKAISQKTVLIVGNKYTPVAKTVSGPLSASVVWNYTQKKRTELHILHRNRGNMLLF
jgi:hypothetical protein